MTTETNLAINLLLGRLMDYAGLFPPAKLDMEPMVRNYAAFVEHDDAWMLGRVIVPVSRLDEFEQHADALLPTGADDEPWHVSALTAPAGDPVLDEHLERIRVFNERHANPSNGLALVDVIELRGDDVPGIEKMLDAVEDELYPFIEISPKTDPRGTLAAMVGSDAGAKIRTGGITADLYPDPADVARFIAACASAEVPFKATAGMHHPLRHYADAVGAMEFGFLNVFVAACVAHAHDVDQATLERILVEESAEAFSFGAETMAWRDLEVDVVEIESARERFAVSFGSCSFDEPREDLRALGLL